MNIFFRRIPLCLLCIFLAFNGMCEKPKKPAKPKGPDKTLASYQVDNSWVRGYRVELCPAKKAFELLQKKTKVKIDYRRIGAAQERSVTVNIRASRLRAALNEFRKYGYIWRAVQKNIIIYPVGKPSEWKTGFGSLKVMDGNAAWISRARVRNANFNNAPFVEVEKLLRKHKYKVSGIGKTPVRVTLNAGNATLKQFLTAVCIATGFDCIVNKQQISFRKGSGIGYFITNNKNKERLVKIKYPVISKSLTVPEFLQRADKSTTWVFLHVRGVNMKYYKTLVPVDVSGNTTSNALDFLEQNLNLRVLYVENNVIVLIPQPSKARAAMAKRLESSLSGLQYDNAPLKKIYEDIQKKMLASDSSRQGLPIFFSCKLNNAPVTLELPDTEAGEFLRRLNLAAGHYGYMSRCGTCYVLIKSGLFHFKGITITPLNPLYLRRIVTGGDRVDVPLDFESVQFNRVSVENILKFLRVLGTVRFGNKMAVKWVVSDPSTLRKNLSFKVDQPTLRMLLDALALRANLNVEIQVGGVSLKDY